MKKTTKLLSILLVLIMCLGIFPISASAATTVDVRANSSYYTYNSSTNTLTLKNGFNANQNPSVHGDYSAQIYANGNLNIVVEGTCYIFMQAVGSGADFAAGIFCTGRLNISGTGTLNIMCASSVNYQNYKAAGIIALSALSSNITGGQSAVTVGGGVKVNIDITRARWSYGIIGNLNLNNAKLSITTGNSVYGSRGIHSSSFYVDSPSAELTVKCNDTESGSCCGFYGVLNYRCGNMTVTSQDEVCDGMYNLWHPAKIYCNTAPTPSTTLWDKTTNLGYYKYIKVIDETVAVSGVSLNKSSLTLAPGGTATLTATITPSNAANKNYKWETSNSSVATVSGGVVTAKAAGTATITVRTADGNRTATCTVTVTSSGVSVTGVTLNKSSLSLTVGNTSTLTATVAPSNATNKNVTWTSSNSTVASVSSTGVVTAKAAGTATITVKTADGNKTATCTVTVTPATVSVTGVTLNRSTLSLTVGGTSTLTATVAPSNATNKNVTWTSSNSTVASVSSTGVVTAKAAGTATITVKTADGNKTATCTVTVTPATVSVTGVTLNKSSLSLTVGNTSTLTATVAPSNATNKNVTWTSSNSTVASVSSTGVVTAKAAGTATITVKTADGNKTATCTVTVTTPVTTISSVTVTGVTAPVVGAAASFNYTIPSGAGYVKAADSLGDNCMWMETSSPVLGPGESLEDAFFESYIYTASSGSFTFKADKYYTFFAHIDPKAGYAFAYNVSSTVNNNNAWTEDVGYGNGEIDVVYYFGKPASANKTLTSISVTTQPTKKTYTAGQNFDKSGMVVKANYSNGTSATITGYTVTNGNNLPASRTSVTISYTEGGVTKTTTVPITVNAPIATLTGIEVTSAPSNTEYQYKTATSTAGLKVTAKYSDGTTKDVTNQVNVKDFSAYNKRGTYTATVEFDGKTATFNYTVKYVWWQWLIIIVLFGWIWY